MVRKMCGVLAGYMFHHDNADISGSSVYRKVIFGLWARKYSKHYTGCLRRFNFESDDLHAVDHVQPRAHISCIELQHMLWQHESCQSACGMIENELRTYHLQLKENGHE